MYICISTYIYIYTVYIYIYSPKGHWKGKSTSLFMLKLCAN